MTANSASPAPPRSASPPAARGIAEAAQLDAWDRHHHWHGFTQMADYEPLVIQRAEGCWLFDTHGGRLLDGSGSLWCNVHGHNHPVINAAITAQLERVAHVTSLGMSCDVTVRLARRLTEIAPPGLTRVFFSSDGSSAVEAAVKLAFQYWRQCPEPRPEKSAFLALGSAYHGDTTAGVSLGGVDHFHSLFGPLLFETLRGPCPDSYRTPPGVAADRLADHYLGQYEAILAEHHRRIAAVVVEPLVQGAAGMVMHPPGFLAGMRQLADRYDVLLICDEVATGFGRTGTMFACQQEGVTPDLMCLGKGLTGGYLPMAATLATDRLWEAFLGPVHSGRQFFHGHTFGGNPLAAAAALASLELFERDRVLEQLPAKVQRLAAALAPLADHPHVGSIRQRGLMVGIEIVAERTTGTPFPAADGVGRRVCHRAAERQVWVRPLGDTLILMPPLAIGPEEIDRLAEAVRYGVEQELGA